ncbi:MAG: hypothetical protein K9J27_03150 [Bacteroidales bacterium]|nr:hypothetical protein [Bacteroidales bacterium]MCF8334580.1 hypothetical protein [Bacteroidales bacterium]
MKILVYLGLSLALMLYGCGQKEPRYADVDVSDVEIKPVNIHRYEKALFTLKQDSLAQSLDSLKSKYHYFLGDNPSAPSQVMRMKEYLNDPLLQDIYDKTLEKYPSLEKTEQELTQMFRYFKNYFPGKPTPKVYSYISGINYNNPMQYADSVLIIAIDMYLGKNFDAYKKVNVPDYKAKTYAQPYIPVDAANAIAKKFIKPQHPKGSFIKHMIYHGKLLYFKDALLPDKPDKLKIKYTSDQLEWCKSNEKNIWTYIVENDLLFSGKYNDFKKLLSPGPFTSEFGKNSAPRIGRWVGWQIVRAYMAEEDRSLERLMTMQDAGEILKQSHYKP